MAKSYDATRYNIVNVLQHRVTQSPDFNFFNFIQPYADNKTMDYQTLDFRARMLAGFFMQGNLQGERALLLLEPGVDFTVGFFGCLYAGVTAVPAFPPITKEMAQRLMHIIEDANIKIILTNKEILDRLNKLNITKTFFKLGGKVVKKFFSHAASLIEINATLKDKQIVCIDLLTPELADNYKPLNFHNSDIAYLQYTSGSTHRTKGVIMTFENLMANVQQINYSFSASEHKIAVMWLPPYHDMGLLGSIVVPLYFNQSVYVMSPFTFLQDPVQWLLAISRYRATLTGGPNFGYQICARKIKADQKKLLDLSSLELAFMGSEKIHEYTIRNFYKNFQECGLKKDVFYPCYGLAEATLLVSAAHGSPETLYLTFDGNKLKKNKAVEVHRKHHGDKKIVTAGKPTCDLELLIVDTDTFNPLPDNEIGEIWIRGKNVTPGYWEKPTENHYVFHSIEINGVTKKYLRTGDLGFMHKGELFITGRIKDLIIVAGTNHYPHDIEIDVEEHESHLRPGCIAAFAVEKHHRENLVIVAEIKKDVFEGRALNKKKVYLRIIDNMRSTVAKTHHLNAAEIVLIEPRTIPKTTSGKLQRSRCKSLYLNRELKSVCKG